MKNKIIILFISFLVITPCAFALIELPAVFSDNMVLQQNSEVAIWGWGVPGEELKIVGSWNSTDTATAKCDNKANWKASLKTGDAGGPYTLSIIGSSSKTGKKHANRPRQTAQKNPPNLNSQQILIQSLVLIKKY